MGTENDGAALRRIAAVVRRASGIHLDASNHDLIRCRIGPRLRQLGLPSLAAYAGTLDNGDPGEIEWLLDAITTNLTRFMREADHFDALREEMKVRCLRNSEGRPAKIRLWSAACSSGEEAYSMAMSVADALGDLSGWDVRILATDLNRNVLATAVRGVYTEEQVSAFDPATLARHFDVRSARGKRQFVVKRHLRRIVTFARLNLIDPWPMRSGFDAIFCRNVLIYFDRHVRTSLAAKFSAALLPSGVLFVGHSESLDGLDDGLERTAGATYRRRRQRMRDTG